MCVDRFYIVSLFLSNPCTPSTLSKEAFVYFVCPTEIPQPPFAWKYYCKYVCHSLLSHTDINTHKHKYTKTHMHTHAAWMSSLLECTCVGEGGGANKYLFRFIILQWKIFSKFCTLCDSAKLRFTFEA